MSSEGESPRSEALFRVRPLQAPSLPDPADVPLLIIALPPADIISHGGPAEETSRQPAGMSPHEGTEGTPVRGGMRAQNGLPAPETTEGTSRMQEVPVIRHSLSMLRPQAWE